MRELILVLLMLEDYEEIVLTKIIICKFVHLIYAGESVYGWSDEMLVYVRLI